MALKSKNRKALERKSPGPFDSSVRPQHAPNTPNFYNPSYIAQVVRSGLNASPIEYNINHGNSQKQDPGIVQAK